MQMGIGSGADPSTCWEAAWGHAVAATALMERRWKWKAGFEELNNVE
jgi:hypothetical protein